MNCRSAKNFTASGQDSKLRQLFQFLHALLDVGALGLGGGVQAETFAAEPARCILEILWHIPVMKLTAVIYPDSETDWLVAECPEIGTASQGKTEEEALANLREATELYLESFPHALKKPSAIRSFELAHA